MGLTEMKKEMGEERHRKQRAKTQESPGTSTVHWMRYQILICGWVFTITHQIQVTKDWMKGQNGLVDRQEQFTILSGFI